MADASEFPGICGHCEAPAKLRCSSCMAVYYCTRECQSHKQSCAGLKSTGLRVTPEPSGKSVGHHHHGHDHGHHHGHEHKQGAAKQAPKQPAEQTMAHKFDGNPNFKFALKTPRNLKISEVVAREKEEMVKERAELMAKAAAMPTYASIDEYTKTFPQVEIKPSPIPKAGRGLFAKQDYAPGDLILQEFPIAMTKISTPEALMNQFPVPRTGHKCVGSEFLLQLLDYGRTRKPGTVSINCGLDDIMGHFHLTPGSMSAQSTAHVSEDSGELLRKYKDQLKLAYDRFQDLSHQKLLAISALTLSHPITATPGKSLLLVISMINHSCIPNCFVTTDKDGICTLRCVRPIKAGEELFHRYTTWTMTVPSTVTFLRERFGFKCTCDQCTKLPDKWRRFMCDQCKGGIFHPVGDGTGPEPWTCVKCGAQIKDKAKKAEICRYERDLIPLYGDNSRIFQLMMSGRWKWVAMGHGDTMDKLYQAVQANDNEPDDENVIDVTKSYLEHCDNAIDRTENMYGNIKFEMALSIMRNPPAAAKLFSCNIGQITQLTKSLLEEAKAVLAISAGPNSYPIPRIQYYLDHLFVPKQK